MYPKALPEIQAKRLTRREMLALWLDDIKAYNELRVTHAATYQWGVDHCRWPAISLGQQGKTE